MMVTPTFGLLLLVAVWGARVDDNEDLVPTQEEFATQVEQGDLSAHSTILANMDASSKLAAIVHHVSSHVEKVDGINLAAIEGTAIEMAGLNLFAEQGQEHIEKQLQEKKQAIAGSALTAIQDIKEKASADVDRTKITSDNIISEALGLKNSVVQHKEDMIASWHKTADEAIGKACQTKADIAQQVACAEAKIEKHTAERTKEIAIETVKKVEDTRKAADASIEKSKANTAITVRDTTLQASEDAKSLAAAADCRIADTAAKAKEGVDKNAAEEVAQLQKAEDVKGDIARKVDFINHAGKKVLEHVAQVTTQSEADMKQEADQTAKANVHKADMSAAVEVVTASKLAEAGVAHHVNIAADHDVHAKTVSDAAASARNTACNAVGKMNTVTNEVNGRTNDLEEELHALTAVHADTKATFVKVSGSVAEGATSVKELVQSNDLKKVWNDASQILDRHIAFSNA